MGWCGIGWGNSEIGTHAGLFLVDRVMLKLLVDTVSPLEFCLVGNLIHTHTFISYSVVIFYYFENVLYT